ncbi:DUF2779 domain-containing protein [Helicobacter salomonis]|uniref:DUF2779 domain-containing protein n=1 Tax=Helicobacter salomonis TaxID=56878 RepID=UPI001F43B667|nr:DUF2779 domain-containing protein [Helicobacter salomonis]
MLWLEKYKRDELQDDSEFLARAQVGQDVGQVARELFPQGVEIVFNAEELAGMAERTKESINQGAKTIYEATFEYQGIFVMVDILQVENDGVVLNEVKSSTGAFKDTKAQPPKEEYLWDLGIQYYVLKGLGYNIKGVYLICLNHTYTRQGALDLKKLFLKNDFLEFIKGFQSQISKELERMRQILENPQEPSQDIGAHCDNPYRCKAMAYCWQEQKGIVGTSHVFAITNLRMDKKMKFYQNGQVLFKDLTAADLKKLSDKQRRQMVCSLEQQTHINKEAIQEFLNTLNYPLCHLDFETYQSAIPSFDGMKPYSQIPFQYSLHIEYADGRMEHQEFLAECGTDGRLALAEQLIKDIPENACVLAYNAFFEKSVLQGLVDLFAPTIPKVSQALLQVRNRILDLMIPFKEGYYYDPKMGVAIPLRTSCPLWCLTLKRLIRIWTWCTMVKKRWQLTLKCLACQETSKIDTNKHF